LALAFKRKKFKVAHRIPSAFDRQEAGRRTTKGLAIWWQDVETSAMCYFQQEFQPTNIYELLFVIFIF
jgi:hypothetical protein